MIRVEGGPPLACPRCATPLTRWNREVLLDGADRDRVVHTLECPADGCEWADRLERHLVAMRPSSPRTPTTPTGDPAR